MGDTHLAIGVPQKSMEIFSGWKNYQTRIKENWKRLIRPEDVIVLAGDIMGHESERSRAGFRISAQPAGDKNHSERQSRLLVEFHEKNDRFLCGQWV